MSAKGESAGGKCYSCRKGRSNRSSQPRQQMPRWFAAMSKRERSTGATGVLVAAGAMESGVAIIPAGLTQSRWRRASSLAAAAVAVLSGAGDNGTPPPVAGPAGRTQPPSRQPQEPSRQRVPASDPADL